MTMNVVSNQRLVSPPYYPKTNVRPLRGRDEWVIPVFFIYKDATPLES